MMALRNKLIGLTAGALMGLGAVTQANAQSQDVYVTPNGTGNGQTWEQASDLKSALANAAPEDTVKLQVGSYQLNGDDDTFTVDTNVKGGYTGVDEDEQAQPMRPENPTNVSVLDGDDVADNVVTATGGSLTNMVITGGNADGTSPHGSAVLGDLNSAFTVEKVMIQQNSSEGYGAVHITADTDEFTMENAKVVGNENGGVYFTGDSPSSIVESTFFANTHDRDPESGDILLDNAPNIIVANNSLENIDLGELISFNLESHEVGDYLYDGGDAPGTPDAVGLRTGNVDTELGRTVKVR